MKKIVISISIIALLFIGIAVGFRIQPIEAEKQNKTPDQLFASTGNYVKDNYNVFLSGLDYKAEIPEDKVVSWVNGLPISNNELQFRYGLNMSSGLGSQDINEVKKTLIREK